MARPKARFITDEAVADFECRKYVGGKNDGKQKKQDILWDAGKGSILGFGMRYSRATGTQTYVYRYRKPTTGKEVYLTIGRHGYPYTADTARAEATQLYALVQQGKDPQVLEQQYSAAEAAKAEDDKVHALTLREVLEKYISEHRTKHNEPLRPDTMVDYRKALDSGVPDWLDQPMVTTVTREACTSRFVWLSETSPNSRTGKLGRKTVADDAMSLISTLCDYVRDEYEKPDGSPRAFAVNPVKRMRRRHKQHRKNKRTERVPKDKVGAVWCELRRLATSHSRKDVRLAADWISVVMLTGLRRRESGALMKANVNMKAKTLHIPGSCNSIPGFHGTKNHKPLTLPLSAPLISILEARSVEEKPNPRRSYEHLLCFPSARGKKQPFVIDARETLNKVSRIAGIKLSMHSFRRTYDSIMKAAKVDPDDRRLILNHAAADVHQDSYANDRDPESLREAMDAAAAWVLEQARIAAGANVIRFPEKGASPQMASL